MKVVIAHGNVFFLRSDTPWPNRRVEAILYGREEGGGEDALPDFSFCSLFSVKQTTGGVGHRVKYE